jgi:ABC-2 type transport system ATP-binding protein
MTDLDDFAIVTQDLTKHFDSFTAVDHIHTRVQRGDIFGFLGPNGAGKTTTIRMLLGLLKPSEGSARVLGLDPTTQAHQVQKRIGYMSQRFSLYGDLTVLENINFYGRIYGVKGGPLKERRQYALEMTGLVDSQHQLAGKLAGGFRQRLALACAILHQPELLFLDEPTAGVDPISRREFWDFLYQLAEEGRTIFVTTHYMDEAENCKHLAMILDGKIILQGTPAEVKSNLGKQVLEVDSPQPDQALAVLREAMQKEQLDIDELALYGALIHTLGGEGQASKRQVRRILQQAGIPVRSIQAITPSLEDVFIASVRANEAA